MLRQFFAFLKKTDARFAAKLKTAVNQQAPPKIKPLEQHHQRHGAHQPRH